MMIVQRDKMSAPSSCERVQRLYEKNIELENKRRRSAQSRFPSDPNAWQQIRENYEAIILEDHTFSEQHNVEYALWLLHYKRIEELRAHYNAAQASAGFIASQGVKCTTRPDRLTKIRLQFKTFLSEASGFYHDLSMKIRDKYGLPLGHLAEDPENQIDSRKDGEKSSDMKKGLISCHRCLIYLGDLARYKGSYGDGDSKNREFAAASSYYLQAASLCPSSGNPHHQLAILASYSGDELVAIYRYFRSLAVDAPFTTARDNLIVAFEKNRQSYAQLPDFKALTVKESSWQLAGKGRGRMEATVDVNVEASHAKEKAPGIPDTFKSFCTRFVRLHGILFTRMSLETFAETLSLVSSRLCELLSSGPEELLNFGMTAIENGLVIIRIVAILIYTVHNVNKETDSQTYAEIVQRAVLLQSAFSAAFGLMGQLVERCAQLCDSSSSYLLPGILVFLEWLAFNQHFAVGNDVDDNQAVVRTRFWNGCILFLNKVLSLGLISFDDEDESCFNYMSKYEEEETENRLALWEDFELRGFVPLVPAQSILDFSRKHSIRGNSDKERKARVKRILTAGKALANVVKVDQKYIYYNAMSKKFVFGAEPQIENDLIPTAYLGMSVADKVHDKPSEKTQLGAMKLNLQQFQEGEEEDEVIVFKPVVTEKRAYGFASKWAPYGGLQPRQVDSGVDLKLQGNSTSLPVDNLPQQSPFEIGFCMPVSNGHVVSHHQLPIQTSTSQWLDNGASLATSLQGIGLTENEHLLNSRSSEVFASSSPAPSAVLQQVASANNNTLFGSLSEVSEVMVPSKGDIVASSGVVADNSTVKLPGFQGGLRRYPVSRPSRHLGPPPGFSSAPKKQVDEPFGVNLMSGNPILDDYSWLDGYQLPSTNGLGHSGGVTCVNANTQLVSNSNDFGGSVSFPFPGKQVPSTPHHKGDKQNGWQDYQMYEYLKTYNEQQLPQQQPTGNHHYIPLPLPEQVQGQSIWKGQFFV